MRANREKACRGVFCVFICSLFFLQKSRASVVQERKISLVWHQTHIPEVVTTADSSVIPPSPKKENKQWSLRVWKPTVLFSLYENNKMHLAEEIGYCFFLLPNHADSNRDLDERKPAPESAGQASAKLQCRNEREGVALVQGQVSGRGG